MNYIASTSIQFAPAITPAPDIHGATHRLALYAYRPEQVLRGRGREANRPLLLEEAFALAQGARGV